MSTYTGVSNFQKQSVFLAHPVDTYAMKLVVENYGFLVYMYYTHPGYQTSIFGKNHVYYIQIFTVTL